MPAPETPMACTALRRVHMSRSRLALNTAVYSSGLGHCPKIAFMNKGYPSWSEPFRQSLPSCGSPLTKTRSKRCLVFLSLQDRTIGALTVSLIGKHKQTVYYAKASL